MGFGNVFIIDIKRQLAQASMFVLVLVLVLISNHSASQKMNAG